MTQRTGAILLAVAVAAGAAEFSADLDLKGRRGAQTAKLHVKGRVYRLDVEEGGRRRIVIVDRAADTATVIDPEARTYEVIKGFKIAWVDPIYASELTRGSLVKAEVGSETIEGRSCRHYRYAHPAQKGVCVDVWHATGLDHFVKQVVEMRGQKEEMILRNIEEGPFAVDLLKIPEGLERKRTPEEIEAALPSLAEAADAEAPVGRRLSGGGELRVKVDPDRKVTVTVESRIAGETVATVIPCHGGQPRENIGTSPWTLTRIGDRRDRKFNADARMFGKAFRVDEVRVKVEKGLCRVLVEQSDRKGRDQYLFSGKSIWGQGKPDGLTITITGDHQAGPTSAGTLVVRLASGEETEEFTLENGTSRTWTFGADQGVRDFTIKIDLGKGGVKVRTR